MSKPILAYFASFLMLATVGCGSSEPILRQAVSGSVQVDGQKVENGSISFLPNRGTSGPAATTMILEGHYSFSQLNGPYHGPHHVVIGTEPATHASNGSDNNGMTAAEAKRGGAKQPNAKNERQAEPKRKWDVEFVVPADGQLTKNFLLQTSDADENGV